MFILSTNNQLPKPTMQATVRYVSNNTFVNEFAFQNGTVIDVLHTKKCVLSLLSVKIALDTDIDQQLLTWNDKFGNGQEINLYRDLKNIYIIVYCLSLIVISCH